MNSERQSNEKDQNRVYVVETPRGFTETFTERTIQTLTALGLIEFDRVGYAVEDGQGRGVGPLHHYYLGRAND